MSHELTNSQRLTAAGILTIIAATTLGKDLISRQSAISCSIGYGIGSSSAVGLYRLADLMKNGRAEENKLGSEILTGFAIAFGMTAIQTIPDILTGDYINGALKFDIIVFGLIGITAGFLHIRDTFVAKEAERKAQPNSIQPPRD